MVGMSTKSTGWGRFHMNALLSDKLKLRPRNIEMTGTFGIRDNSSSNVSVNQGVSTLSYENTQTFMVDKTEYGNVIPNKTIIADTRKNISGINHQNNFGNLSLYCNSDNNEDRLFLKKSR